MQMPDLTILPDGRLFLCNGAQVGEPCLCSALATSSTSMRSVLQSSNRQHKPSCLAKPQPAAARPSLQPMNVIANTCASPVVGLSAGLDVQRTAVARSCRKQQAAQCLKAPDFGDFLCRHCRRHRAQLLGRRQGHHQCRDLRPSGPCRAEVEACGRCPDLAHVPLHCLPDPEC